MTAQTVITRARELLHDPDEGNHHWKDARLLVFIGRSERDVRRMRPDLFLATRSTMETLTDPTAVGDTLILDEEQLEVLAELVASHALREDTESRGNQQMAEYWDNTAKRELRMGV